MVNKIVVLGALILSMPLLETKAQTLEESFRNPPAQAKPIMIWQWMDGLVTKEGITADLEAYKAAGIGGVQNFMVGGTTQLLVSEPANAVGTDNWRDLVRHAIDECDRLGLTFGTHNCPGWSSSAYPTVKPEYSMQKIVWTETPINIRKGAENKHFTISRPVVDNEWDFYRDIAVVAITDRPDSVAERAIVISGTPDAEGHINLSLPRGKWKVLRFGHTTNGKTNYGTAPTGGVGLECDKMSKDAVLHFWNAYPAQLLEIAGDKVGTVFKNFEIDSYEAGGQEWTEMLPKEFSSRRGYDILGWLPAFAGYTIGSREETESFLSDWRTTVRELFAENYYGYLSDLAHENGLFLLAEPYGTGAAQPFNPIDTDLIISKLHPSDPIAAEFWTRPVTWGWPEVPGVVATARRFGRQLIYAEGFTCYPGYAWKDDPCGLKAIGDKAFCLGINAFMLHAAAQNPWTGVRPGMTFGVWGTQWTPGQTWWKDGAPELFSYFARCQALLQRGDYMDDFASEERTLWSDVPDLQWIHRKEGNVDFYFVCNTSSENRSGILSFQSNGRIPEMWNPVNGEIRDSDEWLAIDERTIVRKDMAPYESCFVVFQRSSTNGGTGIAPRTIRTTVEMPIASPWTVKFDESMDAPSEFRSDTLFRWNHSNIKAIKYYSGTAVYENSFFIDVHIGDATYILDLGVVKNMAKVFINGEPVNTLWTPPFHADISEYVHAGSNTITVEVTNLWVNRLVGDEFEPEDIEWSEPSRRGSGRFMLKVPDWLKENKPRPAKGRKTVVLYDFFSKEEPLLDSGLIGPVMVRVVK